MKVTIDIPPFWTGYLCGALACGFSVVAFHVVYRLLFP